jgi:cardiolipin synthase A/B
MSLRRAGLVLLLLVGATLAIPFAAGTGGTPFVPEHSSTPDGSTAQPAMPASTGSGDLACLRSIRSDSTPSEPRIAELYPNPTTHENVGEYLVVDTPPETSLGNLTITDGHTTTRTSNETVSGRVAVTAAPVETRDRTDGPIVELDGTLRLAVDGDELELRDGNETVDSVAYERAPTANRWYRAPDEAYNSTVENGPSRGEWWPRGASCFPVATATPSEATVFVLPDAPELPRETIDDAEDRLLVAGYTVTDEEIAADLAAAAERGVDVAVLFESSSVGGTPAPTEGVIQTLERGGVDVRVVGGEDARYRFHHPKYAVSDDSVLATTENWNPSRVDGQSSRGWGVSVDDATLAANLTEVFETDFEDRDSQSGAAFRAETSFVEDDPSPSREF